MAPICLRREKEKDLTDGEKLKGKDDFIVMCDLEPLQRAIYTEFLDQIYCRLFKGELEDGEDQDGVMLTPLYRLQHKDGLKCGKCGGFCCLQMPVVVKLLQLSSHPGLLQVDEMEYNSGNAKAVRKYEFLVNTFDAATVEAIGGPFLSRSLAIRSSLDLSGKLKMLMTMLKFFHNAGIKVAVFSQKTTILDCIQALMVSRGWGYFRLDGKTSSSDRQRMSNDFNGHSSDRLIMLISTKAGGVGLTLTGATKVIIFDVSWNPADDLQAQDRPYRIGQQEHVAVYRLVAKGTVEELVYMRQLRKQELQGSCVQGTEGPQNFDQSELHGMGKMASSRSLLTTCRIVL